MKGAPEMKNEDNVRELKAIIVCPSHDETRRTMAFKLELNGDRRCAKKACIAIRNKIATVAPL